MSTTTVPASQLVIITPKIEIWSGSIKMDRDADLPTVTGQLPPKGLVTDGRKQLIPTTPLLPMHNVRKQIERSLKSEGFSGLVGDGSVAVTVAKSESFLGELPNFRQAFEAAREGLIQHLSAHYDAQEAAFPSWASMLRSARLTADQVRNRCRFDMRVFRMAPADGDPNSVASKLYQEMMESALPTLLQDIAAEARKVLERFQGKACVKQEQVDPIKRMVKKLAAFAFLDPRVQPVSAGLQSVLDSLPLTGALNTPQTACCITVLQQLTNPRLIISHGIGVIAYNAKPPQPEAIQDELPIANSEVVTVPMINPANANAPSKRRGFAVAL